jgi:RNA polymerase sigma-70 factor, ECF subfamily
LPQLGISADETEDVVQEILIGLHTMRRRWDPDRPFRPWMFAIVKYKLSDAARKRRREALYRRELSAEEWCNVAEAADDGSRRPPMDFDKALQALPRGQRELVRTLAIDGASIREAAEKFRTSEGTIRMTLHRVLNRLAAFGTLDAPAPRKAEA